MAFSLQSSRTSSGLYFQPKGTHKPPEPASQFGFHSEPSSGDAARARARELRRIHKELQEKHSPPKPPKTNGALINPPAKRGGRTGSARSRPGSSPRRSPPPASERGGAAAIQAGTGGYRTLRAEDYTMNEKMESVKPFTPRTPAMRALAKLQKEATASAEAEFRAKRKAMDEELDSEDSEQATPVTPKPPPKGKRPTTARNPSGPTPPSGRRPTSARRPPPAAPPVPPQNNPGAGLFSKRGQTQDELYADSYKVAKERQEARDRAKRREYARVQKALKEEEEVAEKVKKGEGLQMYEQEIFFKSTLMMDKVYSSKRPASGSIWAKAPGRDAPVLGKEGEQCQNDILPPHPDALEGCKTHGKAQGFDMSKGAGRRPGSARKKEDSPGPEPNDPAPEERDHHPPTAPPTYPTHPEDLKGIPWKTQQGRSDAGLYFIPSARGPGHSTRGMIADSIITSVERRTQQRDNMSLDTRRVREVEATQKGKSNPAGGFGLLCARNTHIPSAMGVGEEGERSKEVGRAREALLDIHQMEHISRIAAHNQASSKAALEKQLMMAKKKLPDHTMEFYLSSSPRKTPIHTASTGSPQEGRSPAHSSPPLRLNRSDDEVTMDDLERPTDIAPPATQVPIPPLRLPSRQEHAEEQGEGSASPRPSHVTGGVGNASPVYMTSNIPSHLLTGVGQLGYGGCSVCSQNDNKVATMHEKNRNRAKQLASFGLGNEWTYFTCTTSRRNESGGRGGDQGVPEEALLSPTTGPPTDIMSLPDSGRREGKPQTKEFYRLGLPDWPPVPTRLMRPDAPQVTIDIGKESEVDKATFESLLDIGVAAAIRKSDDEPPASPTSRPPKLALHEPRVVQDDAVAALHLPMRPRSAEKGGPPDAPMRKDQKGEGGFVPAGTVLTFSS